MSSDPASRLTVWDELRRINCLGTTVSSQRSTNPVPYPMEALRSLILEDSVWRRILPGFAVVAALGALMIWLDVRLIRQHD